VATRTRDGEALSLDAYFPDEAGLAYPNAPKVGSRLNKHTRIFVKSGTTVVEINQADAAARKLDPGDPSQWDHLQPGTVSADLGNPLDASFNPTVPVPEGNIPLAGRGHRSTYTAFAPAGLIRDVTDLLSKGQQCPRPIRVALFYGTGSELNRQGLRAFTERAFWRMIINVPGVEPQYDFASGQRWGIGISRNQVAELVKQCFGRNVPFIVDRLLAFSTGYIGVMGTISNRLIDLTSVDTLALFDCNYGEARVQEAIRVLKTTTGQRAKVVAYAASLAGTPSAVRRTIPLDVTPGGTVWLFGRRDFQVLTHARVLAAGLDDRTVDSSEIAPSIQASVSTLLGSLPVRGTVVSDPMLHQLLYGRGPSAGSQTIDGWYKANKTVADAFLRALWNKTGTSSELVRIIWRHKLPGWSGGVADKDLDTVNASSFGEGSHDFVPLEFAWEILG
jgi:hypothetical protein